MDTARAPCPQGPVAHTLRSSRRAGRPPPGRPGTRAPGRRVLLLVGRPVPRSGAGRKARVLPRREALRERAVAGALPGRPEGQARSPRAQRQGAKRWDGRGFHGPGFAVDPGGLAGLETLRAAPAPPGAWRSPARRLARFAPLAGRWPAPRRCRRPGGRAPRGQAGCLRGAGGARPRTARPGGPGASLARLRPAPPAGRPAPSSELAPSRAATPGPCAAASSTGARVGRASSQRERAGARRGRGPGGFGPPPRSMRGRSPAPRPGPGAAAPASGAGPTRPLPAPSARKRRGA